MIPYGDGVAPNFTGLLATPGILTRARGTDTQLDESHYARASLGLVEALLGLGRFADAHIAAARALEHPRLDSAQRQQ